MRENCPGKFNQGSQVCHDCKLSESTVKCPDGLHEIVCGACKQMFDMTVYGNMCPLCNHVNGDELPIDFEESGSE